VIDLREHLAAVHRSVAETPGDPDELIEVTLRRTYPTDPADLWSAITEPERIARWFAPVSGQLSVGGAFQLEGNAGGRVLACEPPSSFRTTFGDASSVVSVTLTAVGAGETELRLDHSVPLAMAGSVAGALFAGPGWDEAFLRLTRHLAGDPRAMDAESPEVLDAAHRSVLAWVDVASAAGATAEQIEPVRQMAMAQFAPHVAAG
jgi:uncharacterized protein YndB with AHSA1/START domain